jgi:hypothetical protein
VRHFFVDFSRFRVGEKLGGVGNVWEQRGITGIIWEILGDLNLMRKGSINSAKDLKLWETVGSVGIYWEKLGEMG